MNRVVSVPECYPFIVFRHPSPDDPIVMYHVVSRALRRVQRAVSDGGYPVFLYGRDVPIWGGPAVAWALPRGGAISVFHDAINRRSMAEVYEAIRVQSNPMVLAPEGQITYRSYRCAPIQRGVSALAVDAADARANARTDPGTSDGGPSGTDRTSVVVLPAALEYRYPDPRWRRVERTMRRILRRLGTDDNTIPSRRAFSADLAVRPAEWLHTAWETYADTVLGIHRRETPRLYTQVSARLKAPPPEDTTEATDDRRWNVLQHKIDLLLELSLRRAEIGFNLEPLPTPLERLFRIRQRYWERLYPPDRGAPGSMPRAVADASATESFLLSRHMQCADVLIYVDFSYLQPIFGTVITQGSAEHARFIEYLLMLDDLLQRAAGYTVGERYAWPGRRCRVQFGDSLSVAPGTDGGMSRRSRAMELHGQIETALSDLSRQER